MYRLCHSAVLWKRFTLAETGPTYYTIHSFESIFQKHAEHFRNLYFNGEFNHNLLYFFPKFKFTRALRSYHNLVVLDLTSNIHIEDITFIENIYLKELHLELCKNIDHMTATAVLTTAKCLQALEILNLRMCVQFNSDQLIAIALSRPSLRVYRVDGCVKLNFMSALRILNSSRLVSLTEFFMTPDLDLNSEREWLTLQTMFNELKLC